MRSVFGSHTPVESLFVVGLASLPNGGDCGLLYDRQLPTAPTSAGSCPALLVLN